MLFLSELENLLLPSFVLVMCSKIGQLSNTSQMFHKLKFEN